MNSNFEFCNKYWPDLYALGQLAENYLYTDSNACIIKIGMMSENILLKIFDYEKIVKPEITTSLNLTKILRAEDLLPRNVEDSLYIIRKARNSAVHSNLNSLEEAQKLLKTVYNLCNWFMVVYGDWKYDPKEFILPEEKQAEEAIQNLEDQINEFSESEETTQTLSSEIPVEKRIEIGKEASDKMVQLDPEDQELVASEKIRLEATVVPMINYAMTQNDIKIVPSIYLKNNTASAYEDIVIKIEASPEFVVAYTYNVSYIPENGEILVNDINLQVNVDYLVNLTEKVSGNLTIKVYVDDQELNNEIYDITLLAYDQWNGISIYPEMLCAFVTPNHPLIGKITSEATELLDKWTKNPSMDAYQSGDKNRVRMQAAAIYGSIQRLNVAYSECPASFGIGQRIRMCETIGQQKIGNCVDMSLLYAACLEAVGIHPLLILKEGHAFLGYWLKDTTLTEVVSDDQSVITKRIADGVNEIRVVECTAMCYKSNISYEKAEQIAENNLREHDFQCVIDVKCARLNNIIPISSRVIKDNGWVVERKDATDNEITDAPDLLSSLNDDDEIVIVEKEYTKQEQWERKLLDLGLRNRLINMHLNSSIVPILCNSINELENKLSDKEKFRLLSKPNEYKPSLEKDDFESISDLGGYEQFVESEFENNVLHTTLTEGDLNKITKTLYRKARTSLEENGANSLFLAMGILKWCELKKTMNPHYAPILLLPVNLVKKASATEYSLEIRDEEPQINISLLEKLKQDFDLTIPGLDSLPEDESGIDVNKVLTIFRKGIMNQSYWNVLDSAYLGIFSFSSFVMWNDLHSRYDDISKNKIVKSLVDQQISWDINAEDDSESETYLPITLDASQLSAVKEAAKGKSFILHGPPGTGKSQTITALIANALGNGKKVLFVAEKRAALDVVQERLARIGLAPFCLEMHSNKTNKTAILDHLREAEEIKKKRTSQDFEAKLAQLLKVKEELDDYASELHVSQENGISLYDAINNFEKYSSYPDLEDIRFEKPEKMNFEELENNYAVIENLVSTGRKIGHPHNHPLKRVKLDQYTPQIREDAEKLCADYESSIYDFFDDIDEFANEITFGEIYEYDKCLEALELAKKLSEFKNIPESWAQIDNPEEFFNGFIEFCDKKISEQEARNNLSKYFNDSFFEYNLSKENLDKLSDNNSLSLKKLDEIFEIIKKNYKYKLITTFDVLKLSLQDLSFVDDKVINEISLVDSLIHTINKLGDVKTSKLKSIKLADTSLITRQKVYSIVGLYKIALDKLNDNLKEFAGKVNKVNESCNELIKIIFLLKEWENIPRDFAKQENISLYLADIEEMSQAALKSADLKKSLDERWTTQFFDLNAEELSNEYNRIETSGMFNKLFEAGSFKKKLAVYYKGELDKNNIKSELDEFVSYQKQMNKYNSLFDKYGDDLGYLYAGSKTDWNHIIEFTQTVLEKSRILDESLKDNRFRSKYAADENLLSLITNVINNYNEAKEKRKEFNSVLCIYDADEENWIKKDLDICNFIAEKQSYVKNWFEYNSLCNKADELNLNETVAYILEKSDSVLVGRIEASNIISDLIKYQALRDENNKILKNYEFIIVPYSTDLNVDWDNLKAEAKSTAKLEMNFDSLSGYKEYRIHHAGKETLNKHFDSLPIHKKNYEELQKKLYELLNVEPFFGEDWYDEERNLCGNVSEQINSLRDWTIFNKAVEQTKDANLGTVVNNYINGIEHDDLLNAYKKAYYKSLTEVIISKSLVLSNFSGGVFEDKIQKFKSLDLEIKETNQKLIFNNIVKNIPDIEKEATKSNEVALLNRAIQNKGRGRSLRKLFSQLPTLITRLCPCVLMSPLSVAQYLDPESALFDLIVFDEASQLQTCKAIGAIARAENAVIVGDPKQMPPTNFFTSSSYDEEHEDIEDLESILDDCLAIKMPSKHLMWHYRSTHESLIAFSNSRFYENKLFTFPSFNDRESKVKYINTKGVFERGKKRTNLIEAKAIVEELRRRCNNPKLSDDSVGVVTFNSTQQDLIEDLIADECAINKKFNSWINREDDKAFFVKNLENIQGDERDVILFSVCYGPDAKGKISMNFGPLNKEGGWRRLNVAISRARKEMVVYASLVPEQIRLTKTEGVSALRDFLEFARSGRLNLESSELNKDKYNSSGILDSICDELSEKGYKCDKLIGHSDYRIDIGVVNPERTDQYLLGILIDGPNYQIAENTRDREVAQADILKQLGWNIYRLWSVDWWNDKEKVISRIEKELSRAMKNYLSGKSDDLVDDEENINEVILNVDAPLEMKRPELSDLLLDNHPKFKSSIQKEKNWIEKLDDIDVEVIENTSSSGIVWVVYDENKKDNIESILRESKYRFALERRGAVATNGRKAYRVMTGGR